MPEILEASKINSKQQEWFNTSDLKWFTNNGQLIPPKDYLENLKYRVWIIDLDRKDIDDDHKIKASILQRCKIDPIFFFNTFLWTQDPRKHPSDLPFVTYDYEDQYINWIIDHINKGKDCLTEKSRDMGMSWTLMGVVLWKWMFQDGFLTHTGSKKEDDVDRSGDIRSLFEKERYLLRKLPSWLRPYGFDWKKHSMFMRLINPMNNNTITGESSNRDFGRAGRYSLIILDEFASMEYAAEAWTSTGDSTPCRVVASTPAGTGNKFWQLRYKSKIDHFVAHWTMHPEKAKDVINAKTNEKLDRAAAFELWKANRGGNMVSSPWYEAEKNRRLNDEKQSKVDIAQELDIDYIASGDPYFDIPSVQKQVEWQETEDWLNFDVKNKKLIIGAIVNIDGKLEFRPNKNGWLRLFEIPRPAGQYVIGIDPAEGLTHGDYSALCVREKKTRNLIAGIYGVFDYDELAMYGSLISRYFNGALICAEAGGYGAAVNKRLYDLGANVARAVDLSTGAVEERDKLGFITSSVSRPKMLGDMEADLREGICELRDKDLKNECLNFINNNGRPQAADGSTDDFIMAFAIAGQLLRISPYSEEKEKSFFKKNKLFSLPPKNMGFGFRKNKEE